MNPQLPEEHSYKSLSENGLRLPEIAFNAMINEVKKGILNAMHFFKEDSYPQFTFSNEIPVLGFSAPTNSINLRVDYLNLFIKTSTPIEYKDQLICFVPDKFYMIIKYIYWLKIFGIEQTIHYYQKNKKPSFTVSFPEKFPDSLSRRSLIFSNLEVEARKKTDEVLKSDGENPLWEKVHEYFSSNFSDYYNKSIEELVVLPKPTIEISYEMENLVI